MRKRKKYKGKLRKYVVVNSKNLKRLDTKAP